MPCPLQEQPPNDCGVLAVKVTRVQANDKAQPQVRVDFAAVHCSQSMGFAYHHPQLLEKPVCHILRQLKQAKSTLSLASSATACHWNLLIPENDAETQLRD